ncbi:hypothetical protein FQR65_LT09571 [Abscondita terminalis]|nr:hypothetical protein FQR65_LT09571 [Abscondita terminalis]
MKKHNKLEPENKKSDSELRRKFFERKNSLLTDLCQDKDKAAVAHLFMAVIIGYLGYAAIEDAFYNKRSGSGIKFILTCFPKFGLAVAFWIVLFLGSLLLFLGFQLWGRLRIYLFPKSMILKTLDTASLIIFIMYCVGSLIFTSYVTFSGRISYSSSIFLILETFRMFAKSYAFVRDSAPKILENKLTTKKLYFPTFSNYLHFMFVPTLIYNDVYPRLKTPVRWSFVGHWLIHSVFSVILVGRLMEYFIFEMDNYEKFHLIDLVKFSFKFHFIMTVIIILTFYVILHCVQNIFAELLGFPYKVFYTNWWASKDYIDFFYKWNTLVRDWFYVYVYLDVYENLTNNNKFLAKYTVFILSAVFHEMIPTLTLGYCIPVTFVEYIVLVAVVPIIKIRNEIWANIFFWFSMSMGIAFCITFYILETLARIKCPIDDSTFSNYFTPRVISCFA